jgi:hypothetical protein
MDVELITKPIFSSYFGACSISHNCMCRCHSYLQYINDIGADSSATKLCFVTVPYLNDNAPMNIKDSTWSLL